MSMYISGTKRLEYLLTYRYLSILGFPTQMSHTELTDTYIARGVDGRTNFEYTTSTNSETGQKTSLAKSHLYLCLIIFAETILHPGAEGVNFEGSHQAVKPF